MRLLRMSVLLLLASAAPVAALEAVGSRLEVLRDPSVTHPMPTLVDGEARAWGLGPVAGFRGEVTVWDGVPHACVLDDDRRPRTLPPAEAAGLGVGFLAWGVATRSDWAARGNAEAGVDRDLDGLAERVRDAARASGIDLEQAGAVFRLEGTAASITYHVIWREPDERPLAEGEDPSVLHRDRKIMFTRENVPVRLVGVFAPGLVGTHTHPGNPCHVHAIVPRADRPGSFEPVDTEGGHVDALRLAEITDFRITAGR